MDLARNEEMRQAIVNEEECRRNHGYRRAVIPNPTPVEQANIDRACREAEGQSQEEGQGQGQASASAVAEEGDDDSGSDEEHEVAYLKSLKTQRSK